MSKKALHSHSLPSGLCVVRRNLVVFISESDVAHNTKATLKGITIYYVNILHHYIDSQRLGCNSILFLVWEGLFKPAHVAAPFLYFELHLLPLF